MNATSALIGKTIAALEKTAMIGHDIHYSEEVSWERVTITFTDGTSIAYDLSDIKIDPKSVSERDRVCPSCNRSFDRSNINCWLEELHWKKGKDVPPGRVILLAGHRQSHDSPDSFGPFDSLAEAREYAIEQVRDGDWDPDGVTIEFSRLSS